jgi:hypothetical protein
VLVARLRIVLVAIVPALAQDGEFDVVPAEEPASACAWGPVTLPPRAPLCPECVEPLGLRTGRVHGELRGRGSDVGGLAGEREGHLRASSSF